MKDIMSNGYRGGCNTMFFESAQAVMDRLNMEDTDMDVSHASLMAFVAPVEQIEKLQNEISISSRLLPWDVHAKTHNYFPGGKGMYDAHCREHFGLDAVHFGEDLRASQNMEYMSQVRPALEPNRPNHTPTRVKCTHTHTHTSTFLLVQQCTFALIIRHRFVCAQGSVNNALCFTGPYRTFDPFTTKAHVMLSPGMGHWGSDARPGDVSLRLRTGRAPTPPTPPPLLVSSPPDLLTPLVLQARWRRGEAVSMMSAREQMLSYEQLQYLPKPKI